MCAGRFFLDGGGVPNFRIAWWNTHFSTPNGRLLDVDDRIVVMETILKILSEGTDIICLGVISAAGIEWLKQNLDDHFTVFDYTQPQGRLRFNLGVISRNDTSLIADSEFIIDSFANS